MKIIANDIRVGNVLEHKKRLWIVTKIQHTQPGKGGAYIQTEMKDIKSGTKLNERFRSSENIEKARLDEVEMQFLYADGQDYTFMNPSTYDQATFHADLLGEGQKYLKDGLFVQVVYYEGEALSVKLPESVTFKIEEADPVVKGQTASSSYKPATLENGQKIMVPPHIEAGTKVVVSTLDGSYLERAKE